MGRYHQVVLRNDKREFLARIDPEDFGYSLNFGAGSDFDTKVLPAVVASAAEYFGAKLEAMWIDDYSGDGWDCDPPGFDRHVPWDGPASLYEEPNLPYVVPAAGVSKSERFGRDIRHIHLVGNWAAGPLLRKSP
ncbi:hypothetical protein D2E76_16555 [Mycobacteroides abscessus]|uniref:Uncharacterized protein n=1 Tax=Mycobacteroides abscessus TaxID=36809 RepID=A0ABD7HM55_9MYCO|nr:hypothetical protein [Mycobacteroides abscessus]RIT36859.1 hypothetical protein D2E76_16555 [Mycobacteroides abscessus]